MELWQSILTVSGAFITFVGFVIAVVKFADPIKRFFSKVGKVENIEKNYADIKRHDLEIKNLQSGNNTIVKELEAVKSNIIELGEITNDVAQGVKCLLGKELGYINDKEHLKNVYENFQKREKVVSFCQK